MQITSNKVVSLKYKLSNHQSGEKIEETNEENPLVFLYGVGGLIPEFEENLADKKIGDTFDFHIIASNAYGDHDPEHIAMIPSNVFHDDNGNFDNDMFQVGAMIPMSDSEGNHMQGKIVEVDEENVKMVIAFLNTMAEQSKARKLTLEEILTVSSICNAYRPEI
jgi:FKBP-type peptidyl-prolyl cis-trans isomerase SlyD